MSHQNLGHYGHSKHGHLSAIFKELFAFLDPYADLKYQCNLLSPRKKDSTAMIQEELAASLLDEGEEGYTEEEW